MYEDGGIGACDRWSASDVKLTGRQIDEATGPVWHRFGRWRPQRNRATRPRLVVHPQPHVSPRISP